MGECVIYLVQNQPVTISWIWEHEPQYSKGSDYIYSYVMLKTDYMIISHLIPKRKVFKDLYETKRGRETTDDPLNPLPTPGTSEIGNVLPLPQLL